MIYSLFIYFNFHQQIGGLIPSKTPKKVSFSPTKEYLPSGEKSPLVLSPSSSGSSAEKPTKPKSITSKRLFNHERDLQDKLSHLKSVNMVLEKKRGQKTTIAHVDDDRILKEIPYVLLKPANWINDDILVEAQFQKVMKESLSKEKESSPSKKAAAKKAGKKGVRKMKIKLTFPPKKKPKKEMEEAEENKGIYEL